MSDPVLFGKPGYTSGLLKELLPLIGWTNTVAGNYVIVDHENGEFSMYAHLQEGSILVKAGESVKKGQVVGKVGNTGNSGAPHLHFQLMDSANFFTANGLPVMFGNVPKDAIISEFPVEANCPGVQRQHLHGDTVKPENSSRKKLLRKPVRNAGEVFEALIVKGGLNFKKERISMT